MNKKVFVGNVPFNCTPELFKKLLETIEGYQYGDIIMDSSTMLCKGYGFIVFDKVENAEKIKKREDIIIDNRILRFTDYWRGGKYKNTNYNVQPLCIKKKQIEIKPYNRLCILVENIPLENTREYLKLIFSEYELIKYYIQTDKKTGIPKNSGIIELKNTEDYKKLLEKNTIEDMNNNTLQLIKYNII